MTNLSGGPLHPPPVRDSTRVDGRTVGNGMARRWRWWLQSVQVSPAEREEADADSAIRERWNVVTRPNLIAVLGAKGGSGKTTTAMIVADLLADRLRLRTLAVDLTTSPGTLAALAPEGRRAQRTVVDVIRDRDLITNTTAFRNYVAIFPSGLHVLGAPADTEVMHTLTEADRDHLFRLLQTHYELVVVDLGDQIADKHVVATVKRADQIVVVSTPENVTSAMTAKLLSGLDSKHVTLAVNKCFVRGAKDLQQMEHSLRELGLDVGVTIPYDFQLTSMLDAGGFSLGGLDERSSRTAWKQLAGLAAKALA